MDQTHIHLVITHLPIFGSFLGALVLVHGMWTKSVQTKIAAFNLFIISAIGTGIAYFTGEGAEEAVENIQGISENIIDQHEDFAMFALISLIVLGVSALLSLLIANKNNALSRAATIATLCISLVSFGLVARTGYLGGQIRHSEIRTGVMQNNSGEKGEEKESDD